MIQILYFGERFLRRLVKRREPATPSVRRPRTHGVEIGRGAQPETDAGPKPQANRPPARRDR